MFKRSYCLKCKSNTESINPKVLNASNENFFSSKFAVCNSNK